uniref:DNA polymerase beta domain protein n=1 Tax=uncultured Acetothermia bacterium TaxID=236499 RepID=H5SH18_9BACT|nr:DNA polymerase beta domain protein [uncultured Acetothermia bacterium]
MPVRSLRSCVLTWPKTQAVTQALCRWAQRLGREHPDVLHVGYFGSYARGDAGVGSDLDIVIIVAESALPFERRSACWDATDLPVPADVLVYTATEWQTMQGRLGKIVWVYTKGPHVQA